MKIWVIWTGYVWLIQAVWLTDLWFEVTAVDIFQEKIDQLNAWIPTIYENWLEELLQKTYKNINFTTDKTTLKWSDVIFLCVWTPQDESGKTDLTYIRQASKDLREILIWDEIIVVKSTVPVWTNKEVYEILWEKNPVVSNPEFLREWLAIHDFFNPDRVVLGFRKNEDKKVIQKLEKIYSNFEKNWVEIFKTDWQTAELIKYAANSFLATKITFINEVARLADSVWADVRDVAKAIWMDPRVGEKFLNAWIGYGWSCFPKDVKSLIHQFWENWLQATIIEKVDYTNSTQVHYFLEKIYTQYSEDLHGKVFAIVGLAFKPDTDDLRESRSLIIVNELIKRWAMLRVFDYNEKARENFEKYSYSLSTGIKNFIPITHCKNFKDCIKWCDALVVTIEDKNVLWEDLGDMKLKDNIIFDWKNIISKEKAQALGFKYFGVGC